MLWYLHEHYETFIVMTQIQALLVCKEEKCSELLIRNLQVGKKQKPDFPSSRTAVIL